MKREKNSETPLPTAAEEIDLVKFSPSPIHGIGAFAKTDIRAGDRLMEYVGEKIDKRESLRRCQQNNQSLFALNDEFDLDGNVSWNPARFLNHSCEPNCEARRHENRIWIVARRGIRACEEITFNYCFDLDDYKSYPCHCASTQCVGYIVAEEFFEHVRSQRELSSKVIGNLSAF